MIGDGCTVRRRLGEPVSLPFAARRESRRITPATFAVRLMRALIEGIVRMKTYEFDVVVKDASEITDDQADALFAAGCDDGTPASCNGLAWIHFDREAA